MKKDAPDGIRTHVLGLPCWPRTRKAEMIDRATLREHTFANEIERLERPKGFGSLVRVPKPQGDDRRSLPGGPAGTGVIDRATLREHILYTIKSQIQNPKQIPNPKSQWMGSSLEICSGFRLEH